MLIFVMMMQAQFEKSARLKDHQVNDSQKLAEMPQSVPVHLQNGRRLPPVDDNQLYYRPFENGAPLRPDWRTSTFQTSAAVDRSTFKSASSHSGTSRDSRTRRPEHKPTAK